MKLRTFGELTLRAATWVMTGVEPHVAIRLKQLFPRIPKEKVNPFLFPHDKPTCADLDWFLQRYPMEMSEDDRAMLLDGRHAYEQSLAELERIMGADWTPPAYLGLRPGQVIRQYQAQVIEVLLRNRGVLCGDDLGLGKTYTAAGLWLNPEALPGAAVVQSHLPKQWLEKLTEFTSLRVHTVKTRKPYELPPADVYVFKYSILTGWVDIFATGKFKSVAWDEIQELRRGTDSDKGRAAQVLFMHVLYSLGLSATPIYNYGGEIWNIMQVVDPLILGSWADFTREWCVTTGTGWSVKDPEALGTFLREQHRFVRRTKKDVGQQVPPVNRIVHPIVSDPAALQSIEDLARKLALSTIHGTFTQRGMAARELDLRVRHATGVGKALAVAAYVRVLLAANVPVMLMGWHRDVYDIWLKELADFKPVMYTGSESPKQKNDAKEAFVTGKTKLFIMSLRSGAGVDGLQFVCSTVVFGELDWSPKVHEQIVGRLDREGQTEQVTAIYLNSDDGSDPPMVNLLGLKASQSTGIVDPGREFEAVPSDMSRVRALAQMYLDKRELQALDAAPALTIDPPAANEPAQLALIA